MNNSAFESATGVDGMIRKTFDGGFSENIYFDPDHEQDFIQEKGFGPWTAYREEWEKCSRLEKEADHPPHLEFELNYSCNLECPMCTWSIEQNRETRKDWFKFEDYRRLIDEAVSKGTRSVRLCYINEPLLRKDIDQFVRYAAEAGLLDIIITTNGTLLTPQMSKKLILSGLTKLNVSLDAVTPATYAKIRVGGDLAVTARNIRSFLDIRRELNSRLPKLRVTFVRTRLNDHEHEDFVNEWKGVADSLGVQRVQDPYRSGKFHDAERRDPGDGTRGSSQGAFYCSEPFKRMTLRGNGDVLPCCSFYAAELVAGNWKRQSLEQVWNGEKMRMLRDIHKRGEYWRNRVCKICVESYG